MSNESKPETAAVPEPASAPRRVERMRLFVLSGPDEGKQLELGVRRRYLIGKADDADLVLSDPGVSRQHLEVRVGDEIVVRDLGSRNGSYFGGARFSEIAIGAGAVLTLGSTELRLQPSQASTRTVVPLNTGGFHGLIGGSLRMRELYALLEQVARTSTTVLIQGETGTGKERCAEAIHHASPRAQGPFVICDLAAISASLIESELFGHVRGAFTGADRDREGAFARAHGGTIFIDEIGELDLALQPRLLRAIEQRSIKPIGGSAYQEVDVRVVAATNRDLREEVRLGGFRDDLYHRLSVIELVMPPLRERKDDIPLLANGFLDGTGISVPAETLAVLASHDWPGNVRELRNVIERARSLLGDGGVLEPSLLGLEPPPAGSGMPSSWATLLDDSRFHEAKDRLVDTWERSYLQHLMTRAENNISRAARLAGIDRTHLHRLLKKHGLG
jgi:DNA-binding NtrC family response regulator